MPQRITKVKAKTGNTLAFVVDGPAEAARAV